MGLHPPIGPCRINLWRRFEMDKDRIKGKIKKLEGKLQKVKGSLTHSKSDKIVGAAKEVEGAVEIKFG